MDHEPEVDDAITDAALPTGIDEATSEDDTIAERLEDDTTTVPWPPIVQTRARSTDPDERTGVLLQRLIDGSTPFAYGWRWWQRARAGRIALAAKGMAYYMLFGLVSAMGLTFGVLVRVLPRLDEVVRDVLDQAFPGLQVDPTRFAQDLTDAGTLVVWISAGTLTVSVLGVLRAADEGARMIHGVGRNPRTLFAAYGGFFGWGLILGPLLVLSYIAGPIVSSGLGYAMTNWGLGDWITHGLAFSLNVAANFAVDVALLAVILVALGGVHIPARPTWVAATCGGAALTAVKLGSGHFIADFIESSRAAVLGVPMALLVLFYAMSWILLGSVALAATMSEVDPVAAARYRGPQACVALPLARISVGQVLADVVRKIDSATPEPVRNLLDRIGD